MKTLKVEGVYPMAFESEDAAACHLPRCIDSDNERRLRSAPGYLSPNRFEEEPFPLLLFVLLDKAARVAAVLAPAPGFREVEHLPRG